jgi:sugar fermentation stimulation protein A
MGTKRVKELGSATFTGATRFKSARLQQSNLAVCDDSTSYHENMMPIYEYDSQLYSAMLLKRYKRFLGDVELSAGDQQVANSQDNKVITVHVPNTGPMTGLLDNLPAPVKLSKSSSKTRKYQYTLEWILDTSQGGSGTWVGVHSAKANAFVGSILESRSLVGLLPDYEGYQKEVKFGSSRIDFQLNCKTGKPCLLEVKSVTMLDCDDQGVRVL